MVLTEKVITNVNLKHPTSLLPLAPVWALLLLPANNVTGFSNLKMHLGHHQGAYSQFLSEKLPWHKV